jgi:hypothetical protein
LLFRTQQQLQRLLLASRLLRSVLRRLIKKREIPGTVTALTAVIVSTVAERPSFSTARATRNYVNAAFSLVVRGDSAKPRDPPRSNRPTHEARTDRRRQHAYTTAPPGTSSCDSFTDSYACSRIKLSAGDVKRHTKSMPYAENSLFSMITRTEPMIDRDNYFNPCRKSQSVFYSLVSPPTPQSPTVSPNVMLRNLTARSLVASVPSANK